MSAFMAALALAAMGTPAAAGNVTSHDPDTLVTALQDAGYKAKLGKNDKGDPEIETASGGNNVTVYFAGCKAGRVCDQIEFVILWDCGEEMKKCQQIHQKWSEEETFSTTIITGKFIGLYQHLLMDRAGISADLFIRNLDLFSADAADLQSKF